jgi:hypothetical protein
MLCTLDACMRFVDITCITASDDEYAARLVGEVLLGERRGADEEALAECVHVGCHDCSLVKCNELCHV